MVSSSPLATSKLQIKRRSDLLRLTPHTFLFPQELDEFWVYRALLVELTKKLTYCVKAELIPLMEVTGVLEVSLALLP